MVKVSRTGIKGNYGKVAVKAVELVRFGNMKNPKYAWDNATSKLIDSKSSKEKGCPKDAFLGLCEEGMIEGIKADKYTHSNKNKRYDLKAIQLLKKHPDLLNRKENLWNEVMKLEGKDISHAGQMDVVVALWKKGFIDI